MYSAPQIGQSTPATPTVTRVIAQSDNRARIQLNVPEDAIVYLVGQKMSLTGQQRTYRLPALEDGKTYDYPIKVEVVRNGVPVTVEHSQPVSSGVTSKIVIVEQAGQLVVQGNAANPPLVADAR